jgi:fibronectin type 3 domain-containing protein
VNIVTPIQHAAEGNRVGFFAGYAAGQRPDSTRVWWGDGTIEELMVDYDGDAHAGTVYGLHDYASPGVYSVTFSVTGVSGSSDTETFFTDDPGEEPSSQEPTATSDGFVSETPGAALGDSFTDGASAPDSLATAPTVTGVFVGGSAWAPSFNNYLQAQGLGESAFGFSVTAADQLNELPWTNVDRVSIRFSQPVSVAQGDLSVTGVVNSRYATSAVTYDSATNTATWTLSQPLARDKVLLTVRNSVADASTGERLDGEWANSGSGPDAFPSGDGAAGGAFYYRINPFPGDVNRNGSVNAIDTAEVKRRDTKSTTNPGTTEPYTIFHDVDGSGVITSATGDGVLVQGQLSVPALPPTQPTPVDVPVAPTGVTASPGAGTITLSWQAPTGATSYNVYRSAGAGTPTLYQTVAATTFSDQNVEEGTTYTYTVSATNDAGEGPQSSSVSAEPDPEATAPPAPGGFSAAALAYNHVELFWEDLSADEISFSIERRTIQTEGTPGAWTTVGTVGSGETRYADKAVEADTQYEYRISATNGVGPSDYASTGAQTPALPPDAPTPNTPPSNLDAEPVAGQDLHIRLTWTPPDAAAGMQFLEVAAEGMNFKTLTGLPAAQSSYDFAADTAGTYTFRLRIDDGVGGWAYSGAVSEEALERPAGPSGTSNAWVGAGFSYSPGGEVTVYWIDVSDNEDGFIIRHSTDGANYEELARLGPNEVTTNVHIDVSAVSDHWISVHSFNRAGESESGIIEVQTLYPDDSAPPMPSLDRIEASGDPKPSATLYANGEYLYDDPYGTVVQESWGHGDWVTRSLSSGDLFRQEPDPPDRWWKVEIGSPQPYGTHRSYRLVNQVHGGGLGPKTEAQDAPGPTGSVPTPTSISYSSATHTLNWSYPDNTPISGFRIERKRGATGQFHELTSVPDWTQSIVDELPSDGARYTYRVTALDSGDSLHSGHGMRDAWSGSVFTDVDAPDGAEPGGPGGLRATPFRGGGIDLAWVDGSDNEDGFHITRTRLSTGQSQTFTVGEDVAQYEDGDALVPGETYQYVVTAYNSAGDSAGMTVTAIATALPTVTVEAIDSAADEAGPNPGRWIVWRTGPYLDRPLKVNFRTTSPSGQFTLAPAANVAIPQGYLGTVVQLDPVDDNVIEPDFIADGWVESVAGYTTEAANSFILLASNDVSAAPSIKSLKWETWKPGVVSKDDTTSKAETSEHVYNPNEVRTYGSYMRIFPEKQAPWDAANTQEGDYFADDRKKVILRADVGVANTRVYFAIFDPDDPDILEADPTDLNDPAHVNLPWTQRIVNTGNDNRHVHGINPDTYGDGPVYLEGVSDKNGIARAMFEIPSMQPGNNFRLFATTQSEQRIHEITQEMADHSQPMPADIAEAKMGQKSADLVVWRRLHVERDSMADPGPNEPFNANNDDKRPDVQLGRLVDVPLDNVRKYFLPAYVDVEVGDAEFNTTWNKHRVVPWDHNVEVGEEGGGTEGTVPDGVRDVPSKPDFWVIHLVTAYEGPVLGDNDTDNDNGGIDAALLGAAVAVGDDGPTWTFTETIRDRAETPLPGARRTVPKGVLQTRNIEHEFLHRFGLLHLAPTEPAEKRKSNPGDQRVLGEDALYGTDVQNQLNPKQLNAVRGADRPA